jgi:hypothetical protein
VKCGTAYFCALRRIATRPLATWALVSALTTLRPLWSRIVDAITLWVEGTSLPRLELNGDLR